MRSRNLIISTLAPLLVFGVNIFPAILIKGGVSSALIISSISRVSAKNFEDYFQLAESAFNSKNFADTIYFANKTLELRPDFYLAYSLIGVSKHEQGDFSGAVEAYQKALEIKPDLFGGYALIGKAKEGMDDYKGALLSYDKAIKIDPKNFSFYADRGRVNMNLGRIDQAESDYTKAIELFPKKDQVSEQLNSLYVLRGYHSYIKGNYEVVCSDLRYLESVGSPKGTSYLRKSLKASRFKC